MSSDPYIGKKLGNYDIIRLIGKGGMAGVYEATQPSMNRTVAIKVMAQSITGDPSFVQRFKNEAQLIAHLEHAHILPVYDFGEQEGTLYIVMRYLDAGTLEDRIGGSGMPVKEAVALFTQLAQALDYAHSKGVIHRDLKPSNVLVDKQGNSFLSDFGIAKSMEGTQNLTGTGGVVGTPTYMSPEQGLGGDLDARSDIYSLGVILFEMLTGKVPFSGENPMQVMLKHINDMPPSPRSLNAEISPAVESVVTRALAKDQNSRFKSAKEMADALQDAFEKGRAVVGPAPTGTMPVARAQPQPGASTVSSPISGSPEGETFQAGMSPQAAAAGTASTAAVPAAAGTAVPISTAVQPEIPYYTISTASQWLADQAALGRWLQSFALSAATFFSLQRLTPGDAFQNVALAVVPGLFFYGLLNAPVPGGLIALFLLFLPLMAHAPLIGLLWLAAIAVAGLQMTSREMMLTTVTLVMAGTPFGWLIPLAAPWWLGKHRVAFGAAMGVIFAGLFALTLNGWPNAGGLLPTPGDTSVFSTVEVSPFDTTYLGLLDPAVWKPLFNEPAVVLESIRSNLQNLIDFYVKFKAVPLIVAAAWAAGALVSTLFRKDASFLIRGAGIGLGTIAIVIGHLFYGFAGVEPPATAAFIAGVLMGPLAFFITQFPIQAPPPSRTAKK
jgi:serine/threonine-protein kinase